MNVISIRLQSGQDLKQAIIAQVQSQAIGAGFILTAVGSLTKARLRFAGAAAGPELPGPFEITSLVGTLSADGVHLHITLSDHVGATIGGHLLEGCIVHTTVELIIGVLGDRTFHRAPDPLTGYGELQISPVPKYPAPK